MIDLSFLIMSVVNKLALLFLFVSFFHILVERNLSQDFYLLQNITTKILFNNLFFVLEKGVFTNVCWGSGLTSQVPEGSVNFLRNIKFDIVGETGMNLISCSRKNIVVLKFNQRLYGITIKEWNLVNGYILREMLVLCQHFPF